MRKARAKTRILLPDPKFGDKLGTRFVNCLMLSGNKERAFRIFYEALDLFNFNPAPTKVELYKCSSVEAT